MFTLAIVRLQVFMSLPMKMREYVSIFNYKGEIVCLTLAHE